MSDIITYLDEYGGFTFTEKPICEVDGLILAHFSYYVFDGIVPGPFEGQKPIRLQDIAGRMDENHFVSVTWEQDENKEIFYKIINARRFRNARACCYVNELDREKEMQFSAITLLLGNGDIFMSFRGTDDALLGWKEDFYMACRTPVGSQERSTEYVNEVAHFWGKKKKARFYLGGHSKGGNLAVYAAMSCEPKVRRRIGKIYNFDGPGFRPELIQTLPYEEIHEKVYKFIPEESFVGMLMQEEEDYILIASSSVGILQHIPVSWCVKGDGFVRAGKQEPQRKILYARINEWLLALDKERIGSFLESLFELLEVTQAETLTELSADFFRNSVQIWNVYKNMDRETKEIFWEMCTFLMEIAAKDQKERIRRWKLLDRIRTFTENNILND